MKELFRGILVGFLVGCAIFTVVEAVVYVTLNETIPAPITARVP